MLESSVVLSRMLCTSASYQSLISLCISGSQVVCRHGLSANAPDATAPAVRRAGVIIAIFDYFPQSSVRRRCGTIGQAYQLFDATFLF
jgi:hypothetical protein